MNDIEVGRFALRTFRLGWDSEADRPRLLSLTRPVSWDNGVCEAECISADGVYSWGGDLVAVLQGSTTTPHAAPQEDCRCGIYGTLDLATLMRQYRYPARHLITVIAAEGRTIIGPRGLRTARARVVAYWSPHPRWQEAFPEAKYYCRLPEMLAEYDLPLGRLSRPNAVRLGLPAEIGDGE